MDTTSRRSQMLLVHYILIVCMVNMSSSSQSLIPGGSGEGGSGLSLDVSFSASTQSDTLQPSSTSVIATGIPPLSTLPQQSPTLSALLHASAAVQITIISDTLSSGSTSIIPSSSATIIRPTPSLLVPLSEDLSPQISSTSTLSSAPPSIFVSVSTLKSVSASEIPTQQQPTPTIPVSTPLIQQSSTISKSTLSAVISISSVGVSSRSRPSSESLFSSSSFRISEQSVIPSTMNPMTPSISSSEMPQTTTTFTSTTDAVFPLPLVAGASAGGAVLIGFGLLTIVLCCVLIKRKQRGSHTLHTAGYGEMQVAGGTTTTQFYGLHDVSSNDSADNRKSYVVSTDTFGIKSANNFYFPPTPTPEQGQDLPALIIINPVDPSIPTSSNSEMYSKTLPTRGKHRKPKEIPSFAEAPESRSSQTQLVSDMVIKPCKSTGAINVIKHSDSAIKKADLVQSSQELEDKLPAKNTASTEKKADTKIVQADAPETVRQITEITSPSIVNLDETSSSNSRGSSGYVFMELPEKRSASAAKAESLYDVPRMLKSNSPLLNQDKPADILGPKLLPTTKTAAESHYDVPRNALRAFTKLTPETKPDDNQSKDDMPTVSQKHDSAVILPHLIPKLKYAPTESSTHTVPKQQEQTMKGVNASKSSTRAANLTQESVYDVPKLGSSQRPSTQIKRDIPESHYDIPKKSTTKKSDVTTTTRNNSTVDDEHEYCLPPRELTVDAIKQSILDIAGKKNTNSEKPLLKPKPKGVGNKSSGGDGKSQDKSEQIKESAASMISSDQSVTLDPQLTDVHSPVEEETTGQEKPTPSFKPKSRRSSSRRAIMPVNVMKELSTVKNFRQKEKESENSNPEVKVAIDRVEKLDQVDSSSFVKLSVAGSKKLDSSMDRRTQNTRPPVKEKPIVHRNNC